MDTLIPQLLAGFALAAVIAAGAHRARALSMSGALAAAALGTVIFGLGGLGWAIILLVFFISSSALSRLFRRPKRALDGTFSKGSRRDAGQVFANGGIAGLFVLIHAIFPGAAWAWAAFAGALASANADTWATEIGVLSKTNPRLITTGQPVEQGTSGGITIAGTLAALSGAGFVALFAMLFWNGSVFGLPGAPVWLQNLVSAPAAPAAGWFRHFVVITLAGLAGSLVDSFLGATVQAIYHCPACRKETERHPQHICGTATILVRGWHWMDNDRVNTVCTLAGAIIAVLLA